MSGYGLVCPTCQVVIGGSNMMDVGDECPYGCGETLVLMRDWVKARLSGNTSTVVDIITPIVHKIERVLLSRNPSDGPDVAA